MKIFHKEEMEEVTALQQIEKEISDSRRSIRRYRVVTAILSLVSLAAIAVASGNCSKTCRK